MQFITSLFGGSGNTILTVLFALGVVIVLIVIGVWLLKLLGNVTGGAARGRPRRLLVVDTLALDQKRQLVIIRRDDVEHLILTGGPQDVVIEAGIAVEPVAEQPQRRQLPPLPARRPVPVQRTEPTPPAPKPVEPTIAPMTAAPGTVLEELQRAGHTGERKTRVSLRHTGLLRPVTSQDQVAAGQNPQLSPVGRADSDKESRGDEVSESLTREFDGSNQSGQR